MTLQHEILNKGYVIANRYEVIKCLGTGSMGAVYACKHKELLGHTVAIKILYPEIANDKVSVARFRNEIFSSYGVNHPNVVRAYEYIKEDNIVAYTMEYIEGYDLAYLLKDTRKLLPIEQIINILIQMTSGIHAIHCAGIVHRDIKPENILLTKDMHVKIADFGIAKTDKGPKLTEHGGVVGTIDYVSPEYMLNSQVDARSDIYAMGVLGYEMIVGVTPFKAETVYDTMVARLKRAVEPPSLKRKDCPEGLDKIILKALQKDPEKRFQTAKEFHDALLNLKSGNKNDILIEEENYIIDEDKNFFNKNDVLQNKKSVENESDEDDDNDLIYKVGYSSKQEEEKNNVKLQKKANKIYKDYLSQDENEFLNELTLENLKLQSEYKNKNKFKIDADNVKHIIPSDHFLKEKERLAQEIISRKNERSFAKFFFTLVLLVALIYGIYLFKNKYQTQYNTIKQNFGYSIEKFKNRINLFNKKIEEQLDVNNVR